MCHIKHHCNGFAVLLIRLISPIKFPFSSSSLPVFRGKVFPNSRTLTKKINISKGNIEASSTNFSNCGEWFGFSLCGIKSVPFWQTTITNFPFFPSKHITLAFYIHNGPWKHPGNTATLGLSIIRTHGSLGLNSPFSLPPPCTNMPSNSQATMQHFSTLT